MYCKNCGKELPPQAKFCLDCGTPASAEDSASVEKVSPEAEKAPVAEQPVAEQPVAAAVSTATPVLSGKKRTGTVVILGAIALVAVIGIVALISLFGGKGSNTHYVYVTNDNELMYLESLKENVTGVEFSDEGTDYSNVVFSDDGKYLYYTELEDPSAVGTLYRLEISSIDKDGAPEKIASDVEAHSLFLLDNGHLIYQKTRSDKKQVWIYTGEDSYKLVNEVSGWSGVNDDETYGYYYEWNDDSSSRTLCRVELKPDGQSETLIKDYDILYSSYDDDVLLYGKADNTESYDYTYTVYTVKPGEAKEKLLSDVCEVCDYWDITAKDGKFSFYYTVCQEDERTLYDFVTDNLMDSDKNASREEPVFPDYSDDYYPRYGIYTDDTGDYYETYSGKRYYLDYNSYPNMSDVDIAYKMADDLYAQAEAEYDALYDIWWGVTARDNLREELKSQTYDITTYSLHYFNGESSVEIASNLSTGYPECIAERGIFFYNKVPVMDDTLAELSELDGSYELMSLIYEELSVDTNVYYQNVNGVESEFELDCDDYCYLYGPILLGKNELILTVSEDEDVRLCSYTIGDTAVSFNKEITDEPFSSVDADGDKLYYYMDMNDDNTEGDLYCYSNGESTRVVTEIYNMVVVDEGENRYAFANNQFDDDEHYFTCEFYAVNKENKLQTIGDDVRSGAVWYLDSKQVMYIQEDDLYCWDGEASRRVASDVDWFWTNSHAAYSSYQLYPW